MPHQTVPCERSFVATPHPPDRIRTMQNTFPTVVSQPVSVLMPVSNAADVINDVIEEWHREVFQYLPEGSEFLFDEAASTDGTREILAAACERHPYIRVM